MASKLKNISGFPEWLPEQKLVEDEIIRKVQAIYASFGFGPIETPAVELVSTLAAKGMVDKEIYVVRRLEKPGEEAADESEYALRFDLTVPFARYVAQHFQHLVFPFKRYQLQKVWRGERPQKGRFREFYQFDVDIIARDELPISCDAEVLTVLDRAFTASAIGRHLIRLNNRKILMGFYSSLGLAAPQAAKAIQAVDKLKKIGDDGVRRELASADVPAGAADPILKMASVQLHPDRAVAELSGMGVEDETFERGVAELAEVLSLLPSASKENIEIDLSLARGLDYYTGAIFEVVMRDYPEFGSVGSGGRYDDLASEFIDRKLPGVGASFGLTRLLDLAFRNELLKPARKTSAEVLVAVYSEGQRSECNRMADELRAAGVSTEVYYRSPKLGKQIDYAAAKGIRRVLFLKEDGTIESKDLETKEQKPVVSLKEWGAGLRGASEN